MPNSYERISKSNGTGKTDANLANDSNHLGGIPAEDYATKEYVQQYHGQKEEILRGDMLEADQSTLNSAKEYANSLVRNQDFSSFAKLTDVQALNNKLSGDIEAGLQEQKQYTDSEIQKVVTNANQNFTNINNSLKGINTNLNNLDDKYDNLFQSVSNGKSSIAEAITDMGVSTSATDSFSTMASNIKSIDSRWNRYKRRYSHS